MAQRIPIYVSNPVFDQIDTKLKTSYPNSCVLWIERIENSKLTEKFEKFQLAHPDFKLVELYHGTKKQHIQTIVDHGFLKEKNKVSMYGIGSYFSPLGSMSAKYTDVSNGVSYVFLCDVLVGKCGTTKQNKPIVDMDCSLNFATNPTIYAIPYDDASIPRYVIAFHRDAR